VQAGRLGLRQCLARERAVDLVVVGDREMGQAASGGGPDDGAGRGQRVEARRRVAVQVDERARAVGRAVGRALAQRGAS